MHRTILSLGTCQSPTRVRETLSYLHGERPIGRLLVDKSSPTDLEVACWARDQRGCALEPWPGAWAMQRGERPPAAGIDRLRALLIDASVVCPDVLIWGLLPAFDPATGKRMRAWDVPPSLIVELATGIGLRGWCLRDGALQSVEPPPIEAPLADAGKSQRTPRLSSL